MAEERSPNQTDSGVFPFIDGFERFVVELVELVELAAEGDDARAAVDLLGRPARAQVAEMSGYLRDAANGATPSLMADANTFLRVGAAQVLIDSGIDALATARGLLSGIGPFLLQNLFKIFGEIKKFIEALHELLNKDLPKWWLVLDLLIDELVQSLLILLAEFLPFPVGRLAKDLSEFEVHTLRERAALRSAEAPESHAD